MEQKANITIDKEHITVERTQDSIMARNAHGDF